MKDLRSDANFDVFWHQLQEKATQLDISEPKLPRKRRAPQRDEASGTTYHGPIPETMYRRYYFEVLDKIVGEIE